MHEVFKDGSEVWYNEMGFYDRDGGPAVIHGNYSYWYSDGKLHRECGPAIEAEDGHYKVWYQNDVKHREDGPAYINIVYGDDKKIILKLEEWWYKGERIYCNTQEEFETFIKLELFW